ncbi:proteasomal ATPase-associated factor 1-like isoform X2 [Bolinopsis microptera]|uniref:proteasomal ATPase-associated factor 1-like isoform X2 n=1 Tax=Bolinopsis microptera TaxID=2820187 RepID=UPI00307A0926
MVSTVSSWWLSLQHDWCDGFTNSEKVWVSAHHLNSKTCHSFLTSSGPKDDLFTSKLVSEREIEVTHATTNTSTKFTAPVSSHKVTPNHNPVSLDITSTGGLGAVTNGKDVLVFEGSNGNVRRTLSGHVDDVQSVKFFPSNKVLLTGGSDMSVKIWSVEDGSCPVTLTGHKRGITALDGTIKLWVCGTQQCSTTISPQSGAVNHIEILDQSAVSSSSKLVMSVTETGLLAVHSLQDSKLISQFQHSSELTACTAVSQHLLVTGSASGDIITLDIRDCSKPVSVQKRNNFAVTSLSSHEQRVWCGQKDGECYTISTSPDTTSDTTLLCDTTLCGGDCEAIFSVVAKSGIVSTSARDRIIRRYEV